MTRPLPQLATPAFIHASGDPFEIVHVYDDVDIATADALGETIDTAIACSEGRSVVVDLTPCKFIDSKGLMILIKAHRALGKRFWIVCPPVGAHRRLLDVSGLAGTFQTAHSLEAIAN